MIGNEQKTSNYSIWDSVLNDRIIQFENLDKKYRNRGKQIQNLTEENAKLKEEMNSISSKYASMKCELEEKEIQFKAIKRDNEDLKQYIVNMENATSWKITKPIRWVMDRLRRY